MNLKQYLYPNTKTKDKFILLGPPNVGKSTLFNKLTWKVSSVSNFDRFTTAVNQGNLRGDKTTEIIDLPGVTTFSSTGFDEEITIDYILSQHYSGAINVISALSIHRDLMLTIRLGEAGILKSLVVNMEDEVKDNKISYQHLELKLKVPVISISAKKNQNISAVIASIKKRSISNKLLIIYNQKIENFLLAINKLISKQNISRRFIYLEALQNKKYAIELLEKYQALEEFENQKKEFNINDEDINSIEETRMSFINSLIKYKNHVSNNTSAISYYQKFKKIDNFFLKPWVAIPGFILLMCLIYFITFYQYTGGWIQDQFSTNALGKLQEIIANAIDKNNLTSTWLSGFVTEGILGGIFTVLGFLPWIIILFVCISVIEQIGILSRLSIVFDNSLKRFGLNGRALVNIITGVGCNIPGILLSRNINNTKERIVSVMISSLVSCSARVVVYGFISESIISHEWGWILSFLITAISIFVAIMMSGVFSKTIFRHSTSLFISQIPRWRTLDITVLIKKTFIEVYSFLKRTILIVGILNLIVWLLMATGPNKNFILDLNQKNYVTHSFLYYLSYPIKFILYPIGLGFEYQWSVSLLSAFPAKEAAASTLETLFGNGEAFKNILFNSNYPIATIISFLIMFTFYTPCLATLIVMKKEIGWKYVFISMGIIFGFTYLTSLVTFLIIASIYQIINNPNNCISLIFVLLSLSCIFILILIHSFRIKMQNKGISETIIYYIKFKKIYIVISIISILFLITSCILLFL